ncbi:MAG TPA: CocE/NonD family hydrolase [Candidatus Dormibacteraeota bacterium]|nr:CocE/NonD family hydrolase [Candidatus Dormibacteraeota bacterium]
MSITVDLDVPARMRDGTTLQANVYRPEGDGPWPTLLTRLPYGKDGQDVVRILDPIQAARRGFMVVIEDCRGRFASDGEWVPLRFEAQDGYDSVEWAARLPGSNRRVGMYGESYMGNTQWLAAVERPPSLAAIAPAFTWSEPGDGLVGRGGAVELGLALSWSLSTGLDYVHRLPGNETEREQRASALMDEYDRLTEDGYWHLPVTDQQSLLRHGIEKVGLLRALDDPDFLASNTLTDRYASVTVPTFHTAGWHDVFLQGTLDGYAAMSALGREARLLVGPWTHATFADPIGEKVFGLRAGRYGVPAHEHGDANDLLLRWFQHHLSDRRATAFAGAPVRIFVMGANAWRDESAWPLARAKQETWFMHSDGSLSASKPTSDEADSQFAYDPADPVPTLGGPHLLSPAYPAGPWEQSLIEGRQDVLVFTSAPLERSLEVTGRVQAVLHAQSSAPATDWVVRLCDVHPDGRSFNLGDGVLRTRDGANAAHRYKIDLWSTSNVFLSGHRLRVQVTSSCFPRWDRNLNTGDQRRKDHLVAQQLIHHNAAHPSYIELPVVPDS